MKSIFCLLCGVFLWTTVFAQMKPEGDIFRTLSQKEAGQGSVTIHQDSRINLLLNKKIAANDEKKFICFSGFRIQVYMENSQRESKAAAFEREKQIKEKFPELATYVTFISPFWRLRVGNFRTYSDALVLAKNLKNAFPGMSNDISVVRDDEVRDLELER